MVQLPHLNPRTTAVLIIDMHRGHLDPGVATMPVSETDAVAVVSATCALLGKAKTLGIPTIHTILENRHIPGLGREGLNNPFRQALLAEEARAPAYFTGLAEHNLQGSVRTEAMPGLDVDYEIRTKRRLASFYGTDLDLLVRALGVTSLVIGGVNTNTCVMNAAFEAFNRDMHVVVVEECTASMYGDDLHEFGLANIRRCLGWVVSLSEIDHLFDSADAARVTAPSTG